MQQFFKYRFLKNCLTIVVPYFFLFTMLANAQAANNDASAATSLPTYKNLRFDEDWASRTAVGFQKIGSTPYASKQVLLSERPFITASFGLQERLRLELWNNFQYARPANNDDTLLLHRLRLHTDLHLGDSTRVFLELKNALAFDRELPGGRRTADVDSLAFQNAFVEFKLPFLTTLDPSIRAGRQEILFGKQRLLSPADWRNTRRTFDGLRLDAQMESHQLSTFWLRPVNVFKYDYNHTDDSTVLYGAYYTHTASTQPLSLDLYLLERDIKGLPSGLNSLIKEERTTLGGRIVSKPHSQSWELEVEGAYQLGDQGQRDISAWMSTVEFSYQWKNLRGKPKGLLALDIASGQSSNDSGITLFDPLFPTGHAHLGYADQVGRFNIIDARVGVGFSVSPSLSLKLESHNFWRYERDDAFYSPAGSVVIPGNVSRSRDIGHELDVLGIWQLNQHCLVQAGYSVFVAGDFIKSGGASETLHFGHFTLQYTY